MISKLNRDWGEIREIYGEIPREVAVIGERCATNPIAK